MSIHKPCINGIYTKLDYALNEVKIVLHFHESIEFSLMRNHFFEFLKYNHTSCPVNAMVENTIDSR
jgi:hypothetical protein